MSSIAELSDSPETVLVDLSAVSLRDLLTDADSPLDRAADALVAGLEHEVYAGFGNAPRTR